MSERVVVVANRLPLRRTETGWETSPGGLVSAVAPFLQERAAAGSVGPELQTMHPSRSSTMVLNRDLCG